MRRRRPVTGAAAPVGADTALPTQSALSIRGLRKTFGKTEVVHGISLDVPRGSFLYGMVGPNGAGKTTTLSMATGLLRPDAGTAHVLGTDRGADPTTAKAQLGVLADGLRTFDRLTGRELLTYVGLIRGMEADIVDQRSASLLAALDLEGEDGKLVVDYSAGMTKKILLACALLPCFPRLLILDEPLEAVDPVSAQVIPEDPHRLRRRRRHRGAVQPRDGAGRRSVQPRRDHRGRRADGRRDARRGPPGRQPRADVHRSRGRWRRRPEGSLSWLES